MKKIILLLLLGVLILFATCNPPLKEKDNSNDFQAILSRDTLRVLMLNSSTSYFLYRDQPMGYHYDMVSDFCDRHQLVLDIKLVENSAKLVPAILAGEADMIATDIAMDLLLKDSIIYCGLNQITHQVLVQRAEKKDTLITDVTQLIGKDVYVKNLTKYHQRLINLNEELGGGIILKNVAQDTVVVEDLIRDVSMGTIQYTAADEYIAKLNHTYFRNIDISLPLSFDQRISWAVRCDHPALADSLNAWFEETNENPAYLRITKRYFEEAKGYATSRRRVHSLFLGDGKISSFDTYFKKYGKEYNIDWRLLAAIAYQESTFNTDAKSWAGAAGLMGLMPSTAKGLGVTGDNVYDPEISIKAGAAYLHTLLRSFKSVSDYTERMKMALASYNGGIGHVFDARALAEKYGADKNIWGGNVELYLELKRVEKYYTDPVCRSGYFRGDETLKYVPEVLSRWNIYKEKIS